MKYASKSYRDNRQSKKRTSGGATLGQAKMLMFGYCKRKGAEYITRSEHHCKIACSDMVANIEPRNIQYGAQDFLQGYSLLIGANCTILRGQQLSCMMR